MQSPKNDLLVIAAVVMLTVVVVMVGCRSREPCTLVDTPTVQVTRTGRRISVCDVLNGSEYRYTIRRVRRSERRIEPQRAVDTDTMQLDLMPGCRVEITDSNGKTYRILLIKGVSWNGTKD